MKPEETVQARWRVKNRSRSLICLQKELEVSRAATGRSIHADLCETLGVVTEQGDRLGIGANLNRDGRTPDVPA